MPLPPLREKSSLFGRIIFILKGSFASSFLLGILLVINLMQTSSLVVKPISGKLFRSFNRWCANTWWGLCVLYIRKIYGVKVVVSGDFVPELENAIVLSNHQSMADIPVSFTLGWDKKRLGDQKWFVKDIIKYFPGVGWGMLFLDCLFVKRNWTADKAYIYRIFEKFLLYKIPIWLLTFAEGTRFTPSKSVKSNAYARENGQKPLRHLLIPRTKGFAASACALREHLDAVYDVSICYHEGVPTLWQFTQGRTKLVNLHVRRFPIADLPQDEEALSDWLLKLYAEKDELMDAFYRLGEFPAPASADISAAASVAGQR